MTRTLGEEVIVGKYGIGNVTEIGPADRTGITSEPEWYGVTPRVAGYQMQFDPKNVHDKNSKLIAAADAVERDTKAKSSPLPGAPYSDVELGVSFGDIREAAEALLDPQAWLGVRRRARAAAVKRNQAASARGDMSGRSACHRPLFEDRG